MTQSECEEGFYVPLQDIEDRMREIKVLLNTLPVELAALKKLLPAAKPIRLTPIPAAGEPPKPG